MTTREEFVKLLSMYCAEQANYGWNASIEPDDEYTLAAKADRDQALAAVLAVYDAQAAEIAAKDKRIEELEEERELLYGDVRDADASNGRPLSGYTAQAARIAELEAALRAFAPNNIKPGHWALADQNADDPHEWYCRHCKARAGEWQDIEHAPNCPVSMARTALEHKEVGK